MLRKLLHLTKNSTPTKQYDRRDALRRFGAAVPESANPEDYKLIIQTLPRDKISLNINSNDISTDHCKDANPLTLVKGTPFSNSADVTC